jgi:hypothetical protein
MSARETEDLNGFACCHESLETTTAVCNNRSEEQRRQCRSDAIVRRAARRKKNNRNVCCSVLVLFHAGSTWERAKGEGDRMNLSLGRTTD